MWRRARGGAAPTLAGTSSQAVVTIQVFYKRRYAKRKAALIISGTSGHSKTATAQAAAKAKLNVLSAEAEAMEKVCLRVCECVCVWGGGGGACSGCEVILTAASYCC